jgi:hypothetical protein
MTPSEHLITGHKAAHGFTALTARRECGFWEDFGDDGPAVSMRR